MEHEGKQLTHENLLNDLAEKKEATMKRIDDIHNEIDELTKVQSNSELEIEDIDYEHQRLNRPNQNVLNTLRTRRSDVMNILNETNDKIDNLNDELTELQNTLENISEGMPVVKLSTLKTFQDKNSENTDKVFSNPDLLSHISSYNTGFKKGGLTKRHHKRSKKSKNKHAKRSKSRRYRKSKTTRRFSKK